ncbi:MAG TPA: alkaline phosphatase family protein [Acetobacteraceae bacterium]|nr:alkaline phosphatase family protein [Acetobacteraceae bacterium]
MARIEHVVVLMLENRSFDCMLGWLYPDRADFDGLHGGESNPWHREDGTVEQVPVWNDDSMSADAACIPNPDPGELFDDMTMQIFGLHPDGAARMDGFVDNYLRQPDQKTRPDPRAVMHCFVPEQLPVLSLLARSFGVSDRWFASAPCETWPNRLFVHTGTGGGQVNNAAIQRPFILPTVFRRLARRGRRWRVYFHDVPQTAALASLWPWIPTHFRFFDPEFGIDAANGMLPHYSFIEPRYYPNLMLDRIPNDAHPPHNVAYAEQLLAQVYNAVRNSPAWERTLLLIVFDEHGGCFDHVPPPAAVPAGLPARNGFRFDRYGPRVPAVVVSPYVPGGSVVRPPSDGPPFDHTSIIATLDRLFDLGTPLSPRVARAPDVLSALTLSRPENGGPDRIHRADTEPDREEMQATLGLRRNNYQRRLMWPGALLAAGAAKAAAHTHRASRGRGISC